MDLSAEDKAVLAHVVIDPDAWVAHAIEIVGEHAVTAKVERWRPDYLAKKNLPKYQTRAKKHVDMIAALNMG